MRNMGRGGGRFCRWRAFAPGKLGMWVRLAALSHQHALRSNQSGPKSWRHPRSTRDSIQGTNLKFPGTSSRFEIRFKNDQPHDQPRDLFSAIPRRFRHRRRLSLVGFMQGARDGEVKEDLPHSASCALRLQHLQGVQRVWWKSGVSKSSKN
jgi:hypothetical protein